MNDGCPNYANVVSNFVTLGAELISTAPHARYGRSVGEVTRPLEPGFIPPDQPARLTIVSYYPNASTLSTVGYADVDRRFLQWGHGGSVADYRAAYGDFLETMPLWPFYRKWIKEIIEELGVRNEELSWLPLVKLPRVSETPPTDEVVTLDRTVLRKQLELLRPNVIWVQSQEVFENAGGLIAEIQPHHVVQKLYKTKNSSSSPETAGIITSLRRFLATS